MSFNSHDTDKSGILYHTATKLHVLGHQSPSDTAQYSRTRDLNNRAVNTFHLGYKKQSVYDTSDTSRCLFSDKYKTHKQCGQSIQLLNVKLLVHHVTGRV